MVFDAFFAAKKIPPKGMLVGEWVRDRNPEPMPPIYATRAPTDI
jgi:hypothetical protein